MKYYLTLLSILSSFSFAGNTYHISLEQNNEPLIQRYTYISTESPFSQAKYNNYSCTHLKKYDSEYNQENKLFLKITENNNQLDYFFYTNTYSFYEQDCNLHNKTKIIQAGSLLISNQEQEVIIHSDLTNYSFKLKIKRGD